MAVKESVVVPPGTIDTPSPGRPSALASNVLRFLPYVLIAVLPLVLRAAWLGVPLVQDEGVYMTVGMGMRHGLAPYAGIFDNKTPLIYVVYLLSYTIGGGVYTPRVLAAVSLGMTGLCVVGIGREFGWPRWQTLVGGVVFALATSNIVLETNANTEVFTILPMTAALLSALRAERTKSERWYVAGGILAGVSILFKTSAAPAAGVLFLYLVAVHRRRALPWAMFAGGVAVPLVLSVIAIAFWRALPDMVYANYTFNRLYFGSPPFLHHPRELWTMPTRIFDGGIVFWALAALGALAAVVTRTRSGLLVLCWAIASWFAVKATGRDYAHYYVQLLPAIALLAVVAMRSVLLVRYARMAVLAAVVGLAVLQAGVYGMMLTSGGKRAAYTGIRPCEQRSQAIGAWAREHTGPDDRIYNVGRNAEIYFYANRLPASRFMYDRAFPVDASTIEETLGDLQQAPPALVVDTLQNGCPLGYTFPPQISDFVARNYTLVATIDDAKMYELKR